MNAISNREIVYSFHNGKAAVFTHVIGSIMLVICLPFGILAVAAGGIELLKSPSLSHLLSTDGLANLAVGLLTLYIVIFILPAEMNMYNNLRVSNDGIRVRVFAFGFYWLLVPWDEVLEVIRLPVLIAYGNQFLAIKVKKLTRWHRVIAKSYGIQNEPIIRLAPNLENRSHLLKLIEEHTGKKFDIE